MEFFVVTNRMYYVLLATHDNKEKAFNKLITFCDRLDGTVSENIYFKFVVNVMWEPVPGSAFWVAPGRIFKRRSGYLILVAIECSF